MRKVNFSKYVIALMLTAILSLSCIGTAAAASLQVQQDDVTETEVMLQESQDQNAQEAGENELTPEEAKEEALEMQETETADQAIEVSDTEQAAEPTDIEQASEIADTEQATEINDTEQPAAETDAALTPAETDAALVPADTDAAPAAADTDAKAKAEVQAADTDNITGAVLEDGVYVYYENGVYTAATGLAKAVDGTGWYYMESGIHKPSAEGICKRIDGVGSWFYVRDGKYRTDLTGIAKKVDRTGTWYYVRNGVYKTDVTGISKKIDGTGGWYYVKNGVYNTNATGIAKRADGVGGWYYVKNGVYNTNATGIARKADGTGSWYYVRKGVFKTDAIGIVKKADGTGGWYYVRNGVYQPNASGITWKADSTDTRFYYVKNGVYNSNASGIAKMVDGTGGWYYVRNGVYRSGASGIAKKADGSSNTWFYVDSGYYDTSYNGLARKADCSSATQFYVKNGIFTKSNISSYDFNGGVYKITDGVASLKSGVRDLWIQDYGTSYSYKNGYTDVYCSLKVKNTDGKYVAGGSLEVTSYDSSDAVIDTATRTIPMIAPGDTVYCTLHFRYSGEEPDAIGWMITWNFYNETGHAKASSFSLTNTKQQKTATYSKYTGTIKNSTSSSKTVCVNVIYYKDGQMVGGANETYTVSANSTKAFSMTVYYEPDYDSYKLFVSQYN